MDKLDETRRALFEKLESLAPKQTNIKEVASHKPFWVASLIGLSAVLIIAVLMAGTQSVSQQKGLFNTMVEGQQNQVTVVNKASGAQ